MWRCSAGGAAALAIDGADWLSVGAGVALAIWAGAGARGAGDVVTAAEGGFGTAELVRSWF
jgi:hypothetical protein